MKKIIIILLISILVFSLYGCFPKKEVTTSKPQPPQIPQSDDNMYMVSHSEYWSGENGQIIARLLNYQSQTISTANCVADIFYPNKTYFKVNETMTFSTDSYYYNFITPDFEGVYEYEAICVYGLDNRTRSVTNSFHLSPALNYIRISHDDISNQITNLTNLENVHFGTITYNLTQIKDDTEFIRNNMLTNGSTNTSFQNEVLSQLNIITGFCNDSNTNSSLLCQWVYETKNRLYDMNISVQNSLSQIIQQLYEINQTVSGIGSFTQVDRDMLNKVYNCTILGLGCHMTETTIWNYTGGRYTNGEQIS